MPLTTEQTHDDDSIDLNALLGTLLDRKWLIIGVTVAFLAVGAAYSLLATPVYQADAMVQVEQTMPELPGMSSLNNLSQSLGTSGSQAATEIPLITSRSVLGKTVAALNLDIQAEPYRFPLIGGYIARHYVPDRPGQVAPPHFGLSRYGWGGEQVDIYRLDVPGTLLGKPLELRAGENGHFSLYDDDGNLMLEGVAGQPASGHGASIQVRTLKANPGTRFEVRKQRTLATIDKLQTDIDATEQGKDSGIIELTYPNDDPDLAVAVLDHIGDEYVRQNVERNSAEAASQLQFVKSQLPNVRRDMEKAQAALNAFQVKAHSVDVSMQTKALLDQEVALETNIQQLHMQQADIERRYTSQHPAYKALMEQIGQLESQKDSLQKQVGSLPDVQQELLRLTRDVQVGSQTYTSLLNQAQQLDIARAGTVGNVRVVDRAATDVTSPLKPKKLMILLIAPVLGAFLSVGYVLLLQVLNRGVEDPSEIEELGLPVYASIPLSEVQHRDSSRERRRHDGRPHLLALSAPSDLAVEALRSLRTSLHFARLEAKNNVLMISGASPGAGKTFIAGNLAAVIANAGQRVLLVDGDLRKGGVHRLFGSKPTGGLSELLSGKLELEAVRHNGLVENLDYITRGQVPPNPSELLMHANFTEFVQRMAAAYDHVIIDTPPILAVTDAAVIGRHAGTGLLVARFGVNQARELALARQRFEQNGIQLKGAIFNAVQKRTAGYYSYAYHAYGTAGES